jgi:hypothetical protein
VLQTPSRHLTANDLRAPATSDTPQLLQPDAQRWTWIWLDDGLRRASSRPEVHDAEFDRNAYHTNPHPGKYMPAMLYYTCSITHENQSYSTTFLEPPL